MFRSNSISLHSATLYYHSLGVHILLFPPSASCFFLCTTSRMANLTDTYALSSLWFHSHLTFDRMGAFLIGVVIAAVSVVSYLLPVSVSYLLPHWQALWRYFSIAWTIWIASQNPLVAVLQTFFYYTHQRDPWSLQLLVSPLASKVICFS